MSLEMKIERLKNFSKHQKQRSKEENMKRRVKKQGGYGLFCARGFMFGDKFVKIVSNFEIKLFYHCLVEFGFQITLVNH